MKTSVLMLFAMAIFGFANAQAQTDTDKSGELLVKSSIVCGMCKTTIEQGMAYNKGIKSVKVNVSDNEILVKYNPEKITEQEVKQAIADLGYVANDVRPTKEAYNKLHGCCKQGGVCD